MRVVVLGAGLAGLSAAWHLVQAGHRVTVLEREDHVGGMARSWRVGPYTLDYGPHRFHSRDEELVQHLFELLDGEVVTRRRRSRILLRGRHFDYPLRALNVLTRMPPLLLARSLLDYAWAKVENRLRPFDEGNFEGWVIKRFGRTLYREFFGTYTEKAWRMPCRELSSDWAAQRISQANLTDAIKQTLFPPRDGRVRALVTEFWYPAQGGIGRLAEQYARKLRELGVELRLGADVRRVEVADGRAERVLFEHAGGSRTVEADHVVGTIPLPVLARSLHRSEAEGGGPMIDDAGRAAADGLRYLGILFAYVEVQRPSVTRDHWTYIPSEELTVHRLSEFKNFCDDAAPEGSTVVCCEITSRRGDERWGLSDEQVGRLALDDLERLGLVRPGEGRVIAVARLPRAYPVYDHGYRRNLDLLKKLTRRVSNLTSTGRQGLYRYNNMDHSMAMGRKVARTLGPARAEPRGPDAPGAPLPGGRAPAREGDEIASGPEYFG